MGHLGTHKSRSLSLRTPGKSREHVTLSGVFCREGSVQFHRELHGFFASLRMTEYRLLLMLNSGRAYATAFVFVAEAWPLAAGFARKFSSALLTSSA